MAPAEKRIGLFFSISPTHKATPPPQQLILKLGTPTFPEVKAVLFLWCLRVPM